MTVPIWWLVAGLAAALVYREAVALLAARASREHIQRLERLLAAKNAVDAAAAERILARPEEKPSKTPPAPSAFDDMYGVKPSGR